MNIDFAGVSYNPSPASGVCAASLVNTDGLYRGEQQPKDGQERDVQGLKQDTPWHEKAKAPIELLVSKRAFPSFFILFIYFFKC